MASLLRRYLAGEHETVWRELRSSGREPAFTSSEDAEAVALETMRRVDLNVDVLVGRLGDAGYGFARPEVVRMPPSGPRRPSLEDIESRVGVRLPVSVRALAGVMDGVDLCGDGGVLLPEVRYNAGGPDPGDSGFYADPLVLPSAYDLWDMNWVAEDEAAGCCAGRIGRCDDHVLTDMWFAPDELHKSGVSGVSHDLEISTPALDPTLNGIAGRPGVTLVQYLRVSLRWGGFPGYEFRPAGTPVPPFLDRLRSGLLAF